jgi:diguanylate cyclase (GGDEF)-like protein
MRFHPLPSFVFPRNCLLRLFTMCLIGTHVPLIAFIADQSVSGTFDGTSVVILLIASLVGTAITLLAVSRTLLPIREAISALRQYATDRRIPDLPVGGRDMMGELLTGIAGTIETTEHLTIRLKEAADKDVLTGLLNRRAFIELSSAIIRDAREVVVAILDIDHFKDINDRFGHAKGDQVLREIAAILKAGVREDDIVARWAGEEFVILFVGQQEKAAAALERMRKRLNAVRVAELNGRPVTFSGGLSTVAKGERTIEPAIKRADELLHDAKHSGRNRLMLVSG